MCDMLYAAMFNRFLHLASMPFSDCGKFSMCSIVIFSLSCNKVHLASKVGINILSDPLGSVCHYCIDLVSSNHGVDSSVAEFSEPLQFNNSKLTWR